MLLETIILTAAIAAAALFVPGAGHSLLVSGTGHAGGSGSCLWLRWLRFRASLMSSSDCSRGDGSHGAALRSGAHPRLER
jgi:hypothetical protein